MSSSCGENSSALVLPSSRIILVISFKYVTLTDISSLHYVSVHFKGCLDEHLQSVLVNYSLGAIVTKCFI